jgi:hypothetical protein
VSLLQNLLLLLLQVILEYSALPASRMDVAASQLNRRIGNFGGRFTTLCNLHPLLTY